MMQSLMENGPLVVALEVPIPFNSANGGHVVGESYLAGLYWNAAAQTRCMVEAMTPYNFQLFAHAKWEAAIPGIVLEMLRALLLGLRCLNRPSRGGPLLEEGAPLAQVPGVVESTAAGSPRALQWEAASSLRSRRAGAPSPQERKDLALA